MDPSKIREKIGRFRILVIGRANAGKTTILQRVCNTRENPEIYNSDGEKIDATVLKASTERGEHDIENEMIFRSNPGFVFHDSRGFEAGGESEFDKVKAFIASRSKKTKLRDRLHAIWYCIPMDEESRSFTKGEIKFFSQCDTGSIPVIVLFTKFDALYDGAYGQLKSEGASMEEAEEQAPKRAEDLFAIGSQLKFLYNPKDIGRPPKCHVCLHNMDKDDADCGPLMERTAATLGDEMVEQLFVSTQQINLELCIKYAVERTLPSLSDITAHNDKENIILIGKSSAWFPHILAYRGYGLEYLDGDEDEDRDRRRELIDFSNREILYRSHQAEMMSRLLSVVSGSSPFGIIVQLISAAVIILEHSFYIFDKRRYLRDRPESVPSFRVALEQYMASPHATAIREGLDAAVHAYKQAVTTAAQAYEEAVRTAVYTYQGHLPAWMAKLRSERFQRKAKEAFERSQMREKESLCSQAKVELTNTIIEITLNHRLPRP